MTVPPARSRSRSTARAAGKDAERSVVTFLRMEGVQHAERRLAGATLDRGDIAGIPGLCIEVKAPGPGTAFDLSGWLAETMAERDNDRADVGLLVVRRRRHPSPARWLWATDGETMIRLLRDAGRLP